MSTFAADLVGALPRPRQHRLGADRVWAWTWSSVYFALLAYIYINHLERWDYLGFWFNGTDARRLALCFALAMAPLFLLDPRVDRFSTFAHWIIYFFIYIPAVLIPVLQGLTDDVMMLSVSICASFLIIVAFPRLGAQRASTRIDRKTFWSLFALAYLLMFGYALYVFRDNLTLASLYDVYGQRSIASDVATGTWVGYATGILSGCMNPFLVAAGLLERRRVLLGLGILGQVFVYATFALKSVLLSVLILLIFYAVLFRPRDVRPWKLGMLICISIVVPLLLITSIDVEESQLLENVAAVVFMRTYGMVGALTGIYHEFFGRNDLTYFSHINIVGLFAEYPYQKSIGEVIGESLGSDMNSNASFFATDGIAAAGLPGVVFMGLVVGAVLRAIDRFMPASAARLLCTASAPVAISMANTSIFTTLLTGGLIPLVIVCHYWVLSRPLARAPAARAGAG